MWESTKTKAYCLTCGVKIEDNIYNSASTDILIEEHLKENPDHICIKGKIYKDCEHDDKNKDEF